MEVSDDAQQNMLKTKEAEEKTTEAETRSTNVEIMGLEEVHSTVDEFVENNKQNEDRKNTEHSDESDSGEKKFSSEREVQKLSEAEENLEHGKDTGVKHVGFNYSKMWGGLKQHWSGLYVCFSTSLRFVRATFKVLFVGRRRTRACQRFPCEGENCVV